MKRLKYIILLIVTVLLISSCEKEEILQAEPDNRGSYFLPDPAAMDEESVMRRTFYEEEKSYLLFNDTLRHEDIGVDYNGDRQYFTEKVNVGYTVGGSTNGTSSYAHTLYTDIQEKRLAMNFLKTYVLDNLSNELRPYSWLLVRETVMTDPLGMISYPVTVTNQRCLAVALGDIEGLSHEEREVLANQIIAVTMGYKLSFVAGAVDAFYAVSQDLYDGNVPIEDYTEEANMIALNQHGFIIQTWYIEGFWLAYGTPPTKEKDLDSYIKLIFNSTDEEVNTQYANYPIVRQKYTLLKNILLELGYID